VNNYHIKSQVNFDYSCQAVLSVSLNCHIMPISSQHFVRILTSLLISTYKSLLTSSYVLVIRISRIFSATSLQHIGGSESSCSSRYLRLNMLGGAFGRFIDHNRTMG
jgi:hypothetical protein